MSQTNENRIAKLPPLARLVFATRNARRALPFFTADRIKGLDHFDDHHAVITSAIETAERCLLANVDASPLQAALSKTVEAVRRAAAIPYPMAARAAKALQAAKAAQIAVITAVNPDSAEAIEALSNQVDDSNTSELAKLESMEMSSTFDASETGVLGSYIPAT